MSTTTTTPAKKAAAKKAATRKPVRFQGASLQLGADKLAELLFIAFTARQLSDHLRDRGLLIPKDKAEAARRLAAWATQPSSRFDLQLLPPTA